MRANKEKVSRHWVKETARSIAQDDLDATDFSTSDTWLTAFMARCGLSLRRTTNLTVFDDEELVARAVRFMSYLSSKRPALDKLRTLLMGETAVYFEDPRRDTIDIAGARHVVLLSTGFASMRITFALAVSASGAKQPPLLIWKGKIDTFKKHGSVYLAQQDRAWMNSSLLCKWLDTV